VETINLSHSKQKDNYDIGSCDTQLFSIELGQELSKGTGLILPEWVTPFIKFNVRTAFLLRYGHNMVHFVT